MTEDARPGPSDVGAPVAGPDADPAVRDVTADPVAAAVPDPEAAGPDTEAPAPEREAAVPAPEASTPDPEASTPDLEASGPEREGPRAVAEAAHPAPAPHPVPRPVPPNGATSAPTARPGPRPPVPTPPPGGPRPPAPSTFGRVEADGTVYVRTADGERSVGQVPDVGTSDALAFFVRRYEALALEVSLLERRLDAHSLSPEDAQAAVRTVRQTVVGANAVGDLAELESRLDALSSVVNEQKAVRRAEKAKANEETRAAKEKFVVEAEKLAAGTDWRGGVNRFRQLLDEWKKLPRLDRSTDDALWHRFSSARTTYTRRRKAQFAQQAEDRETAGLAKEKIIAEAEGLAGSTDWGPTTGAFRTLMQRWKSAGPAPRNVDEQLWRRFRDLQDTFFAAKQAAQSEQDAEFGANQRAKEALLDEGERLLPVTDLMRAKAGYRDLLDRWAAIGKVPRDAIRPLDQRLHAIDVAIKGAEDDRWRRTNPEARARAEDTAGKLQTQISEYDERAARADARGDTRAAQQARDAAATYRTWLAQAQQAIDEFSG